MPDAWLKLAPHTLPAAEKLLPLPEQEFAGWALSRVFARGQTTGLLLTLHGEAGSGKSALVRQFLKQLTPEQRRRTLQFAVSNWPEIAAQFSDPDWMTDRQQRPTLVICEDLPSLSDPDELLAGWIDALRAEGIPVIVTTDRLPSEIELPRRLVNRLQGGLLAGIRPLSSASIEQLWTCWSQQAPLPPFHSTAVPASITTAGQLKTWLFDPAHRERSSVSTALSLEEIAQVVADEFQLSLAALQSGERTTKLRLPRDLAMLLSREFTSESLQHISRFYGCRSHTTVVRGGTRLEKLIADDPLLRQRWQALRARLQQNVSADCG